MSKTVNLSEGRLVPTLLKFTFPILLAMILQVAYGTVDLLVVGQFGTVADVSGVTIGSQLMQTIVSLCTGLSMGTTILLGQYIGSNQSERAGKAVGVSIVLFAMLAATLTIGLLVLNGAIISVMQTPEEAIGQTRGYLLIVSIGITCVVFYNLLGSIFRGIGDAKTPLLSVGIACVVNIILDLVFVAIFHMGAMGAALATVFAQASSVVLSVMIIRKKTLPFTLTKQMVVFQKNDAKRILSLGIPIALQGVLVSVSFLAVTSIINTLGVYASAAVGIVEKITGIIMLVPISFGQALAAFTAQNYGAKKLDRAKNGLFVAIGLSLLISFGMAYIAAFEGQILTRLFTTEPKTTELGLQYLQAYAIDTIQVPFIFCMAGYFNGCGKTRFVMIQAITGALLIRIPLAYLLSKIANGSLFIVGLATPASTFIQIILCVGYYVWYQKQLKKGIM